MKEYNQNVQKIVKYFFEILLTNTIIPRKYKKGLATFQVTNPFLIKAHQIRYRLDSLSYIDVIFARKSLICPGQLLHMLQSSAVDLF